MGMETDWFKFIPFVEFAPNSSVAKSTGFTPFEIVYGSTPASTVDYLPGLSRARAAQEFILDYSHSLALAELQISEAQEWQKHSYNCKHQQIELNIGDWVLLTTTHINFGGNGNSNRSLLGHLLLLLRLMIFLSS